jgi:hypothetical protein
MDAPVTAHLPVEEESLAPSARVAGEADAPFLEGGFREGNPEPGVRLPGEAEEPLPGEDFGECSGAVALNAGERLPAAAPWWKRRQMLLLGVAVIALSAAGASAFLVSPHNRVYTVPQMASTVRHWAAEMGIQRTEPVAPAASLAGVPTEPAEPVTREKYQPKRKDEHLQEVLALRGGAPEGSRGNGKSKMPPAAVAPAPGQNAGASDRDAPPPGYVPSEPGANPASIPATPGARRVVGAADAAPPLPAVAAPALPAGEPPHDATAGVLAALGPASRPAGSALPSTAPPAQADAPHTPALAVEPRDPVETAGALRPAPLTPADQVQVLELVTQMASMVRDVRAQQTQLRADFGKSAADNAARLGDFERRLALAEARHALSAAQIAGEPLASVLASAPAPAGEAPAPSGSSAGRAGSATAVTAPVVVTPAAAALPGSDKGAAKRYRVQAASPGLALLAEIDRGGGDGAQLEVLVGDTIPGYGKITSIGQRGTAWVVTTEHGNIQ